jgi:ATP-dependent DNA helicase DinG
LRTGRHVIVQAGTGTGKTMGYLVPAITAAARAGPKVVVATGDEGAAGPARDEGPAVPHRPLARPVHLGRAEGSAATTSACQRLRELHDDASQGELELDGLSRPVRADVERLARWAGTTRSGDLGELDWSASDQASVR